MTQTAPTGVPNVWESPMDLSRFATIAFAGLLIGGLLTARPLRAEQPLPPPSPEEVDYASQIHPLLEQRCLDCHGPDTQESNFRVDLRQSLLDGGDFGEPAVVVGNSGASHLVRIIAGAEPSLTMPPDGDPLTDEEIGLLRAWIDQGMRMPADEPETADEVESDHWSLRPLARPPVPTVDRSATIAPAANPIDAFVLRRLHQRGLNQSPPADRRTLIRRVYLDMLGLLPTPEEVEAFERDPHPDAYSRLVDSVLANPHFGERWARHWLDVVRFAESNGFETNYERPTAYHYRDYVVRAFNGDKPFDRFVFEQLAGDAVGADAATGFLVGGAKDVVGSPDPVLTAMQRQDELADMINTTGTAMLGLTIGCARCHNHKFDPITQVDYYAMQAVFAGVQHGERPIVTADVERNRREATRLAEQLAGIEKQLNRLIPPPASPRRVVLVDDQTGAKNEASANRMHTLAEPQGEGQNLDGVRRGQKHDSGGPGRLPNVSGGGYTWWSNRAGEDVAAYAPAVEGEWRVWLSWGSGWSTHTSDAVYLIDEDGDAATTDDQTQIVVVDQQRFADGSGDPVSEPLWSGFYDAGIHHFRQHSRILLRGGNTGTAITADVIAFEEPVDDQATPAGPRLRPAASAEQNEERFEPRVATRIRFSISATNSGSEPCLDELEVWSVASDGQPSRNVALASAGATVRSSSDYAGSEKHKLEHINDGLYGNDRSWISGEAGRDWVEIQWPEPVAIDRVTWGRDRQQQFTDRVPVDYHIDLATDDERWQRAASSDDRLPPGADANALDMQLAYVSADQADAARELTTRRDQLQQRRSELLAQPTAYAGRFEPPATTHRLYRGDPTAPREQVAPDTVTVLGSLHLPMDAPEPERRMALAESIIDPNNPLTARVMANRLWHYHFGRGLVATPSDFGAMGAPPSHPELLDWLAAELRDGVGDRGLHEDGTEDAAGEHFGNDPTDGGDRWSLKHLHRLILLSATYQQSSPPTPEGLAKDADSTLLWRFPPRRLEAEAIRDNILLISGSLDRRMEGPGFMVFHPNSNYARNWIAKDEFGPPEFRRMLYATKLRMEHDAVFGAFDCPDGGQVAPQRTESTTPIQSLNLFNSQFVIDQAERFAARVRSSAGEDPSQQVAYVFRVALGRSPDADEHSSAVRLVEDHGLPALCRAIYNANAFLFLR